MKRSVAFITFFLLASMSLFAQTRTITGTVIDSFGEPLIGVNISFQGKTGGTITDIDGNYTIAAETGDILNFTYIGMRTQQITVADQTTINVTMEDDSQMLAETVVIGYGSARKRDLTGSIVSVSGDDIANLPAANPLTQLQGKIAGVQVVNTGRPGQDPEIRIRGTNSINGYTPLYVVDGLFTDNINYLNAADIESMEILKDPSSLAIFGVRGANGVIIVTTKRAKAGQTLVNINSTVGFKSIHDKISMANAAQFRELYDEQRINQSVTPFDYSNWQANTNWQDEIFQTGVFTDNNLSITGASETNRFYLGIGYTMEEGSIIKEKFSKVTINLSSDYNVTEFLRFGFQVNGSRTLPADQKNVTQAILAAPIAPVYRDYTNPDSETTERLYSTMPDFQRQQVRNPMLDAEYLARHNKATNWRAAGNIYGEVDFLEHFKFRATFSLDFQSNEARRYTPVLYVYNPDLSNPREAFTDRESIHQEKVVQTTAQQDYVLTYENRFGLHGISATAGLTTNYREYSLLGADRSQQLNRIYFSIPNDNPDKWWISALDEQSAVNNGTQWRRFTMSYLVRGLYNYNSRYLFNASYRRDGSSVFRGVGNTWDNFFSFGGGWVVSEEAFMQNQQIINYLKLKGSWGVLGTENTGTDNFYPSYPGLTSPGSAVFGDNVIQGYTYQYLVQDLKWEKTYSWEIGLEMNLFNQRLRFEPIFYNKTTNDIIVSLGSRSGARNSLENLGKIRNRGFELAASWRDEIGNSGVGYNIAANLTTISNKVLSLGRDDGDAIYQGVSRTVSGYPIGYFFGYVVDGVYQNNEDIRQSEPNTIAPVQPGDLKFRDVDGNGEITEADRTMIGNPTPDFTYGFNLNLTYKNFDLGIDMMGVYGNEIYRNWGTSQYAQFNYHTDRLNRWRGEGTSNWEPILDPSRAVNRLASSYFIEDGSFFRIRNLQLGYTFDTELLSRAYIKSLRVYANIQNLKTWKKNSSYTPEIGGRALEFGVDNGTYPMPAIYTLGFNLTF